MAVKSDSYEWIDSASEHAEAFRAGVARNGTAQTRCPICDRRRLFRSPAFGYCDIHKSWTCWQTMRVACHDCRLRWGVVLTKCPEADARKPDAP